MGSGKNPWLFGIGSDCARTGGVGSVQEWLKLFKNPQFSAVFILLAGFSGLVLLHFITTIPRWYAAVQDRQDRLPQVDHPSVVYHISL